jgi:hypothetical protein
MNNFNAYLTNLDLSHIQFYMACSGLRKFTRTKLLFLLGYCLIFAILGCSDSNDPDKKPEPEPEHIIYTLEPVAVTYSDQGGVMGYGYTIDSSYYDQSDKLFLTKRFYDANSEKESKGYEYLDNTVIVTEAQTGEEFVKSYTVGYENGNIETIGYDRWKAVSGSDRWAEFSYAGEVVFIDVVDYSGDGQRVLRNKYSLVYSYDDIVYMEFSNQNNAILIVAENIQYDSTLNPFYKSLHNGFFGADPLEIIQQLSKHNIKSYEVNNYSNHTAKNYVFSYTLDAHSRITSRSAIINEEPEVVDIKKISYRNN